VAQAPDSERPVFRSPIRDRNGGLLDVRMAVSGQIPVTAERFLRGPSDGHVRRVCERGWSDSLMAKHRQRITAVLRQDIANRLDGFLWRGQLRRN